MHALTASQSSLVSQNVRLAHKLANVYGKGSEDAHSDAMLGLCVAAQKFDASLGVPFGAFASTWIRSHVQQGKRRMGSMTHNDTRASRKLASNMGTAVRSIEARGDDATPDAIAAECGVDADDVRAYNDTRACASLSAPTGDDEGSTMADLVVDSTPNACDDMSTAETVEIAHALVVAFAATLTAGTLAFSIWHENLTVDGADALSLDALGQRHGVSKQRAGQVAKRLRTDFRTFAANRYSNDVAAVLQ